METQKIAVASCSVKKATDAYTIYEVKDVTGKVYDSFAKLDPGEHELIVTENGKYNPKLSKPKSNPPKFAPKDYVFEKRKSALECAVNQSNGKDVKSADVLKVAESFYNFLNQKDAQ